MNRNELRKADINLMVVFETLMIERNVTKVAKKLFLGQPTISSALNRLRAMFNDPLFIRVGHRMEPTARAEEIFRYLSPALDSLSVALSLTHDFDPGSSTMTFRVTARCLKTTSGATSGPSTRPWNTSSPPWRPRGGRCASMARGAGAAFPCSHGKTPVPRSSGAAPGRRCGSIRPLLEKNVAIRQRV